MRKNSRYKAITSMSIDKLAEFLTKSTAYTPYAGAATVYLNRKTLSDDTYEAAVQGTKEWLESEGEV